MTADCHFVKGTYNDEKYLLGPKVVDKNYNYNQTITLIVTEFLSPNLFLGYESCPEYYVDDQINILYDSLGDYFYFDNIPKTGTICVSKYKSDNKWYRAKVIGQNHVEKTVDLYFLDYGNIEKNVHMKHVRKLEGTFSTQFPSLMKNNKLNSQAALFGLVGVKPPAIDYNKGVESKLKSLTSHQTFDFQVIDLPVINVKVKDQNLIKIPFYLIRKDPFSKSPPHLSNWLVKELNWEECDHMESLEAIIKSLYQINYNFYNVQFMIPKSLKKHQRSKNRVKSQANNNNLIHVEHKQSIHINDTENGEVDDFSRLSIKDLSEDEDPKPQNDIFEVSGEISLNESQQVDMSINKINEDSDEDSEKLLTIFNWKLTSLLVDSSVTGLLWHLPLPEEWVFRAIVTHIDTNLGFHINVCSDDIAKSFKSLEKALETHYLLCNNSMLRQFVGVVDLVPGTLCLCAHNSTYNRGYIIGAQTLENKFRCKLLDYGEEVSLRESDIIPISDQFCQLPALAIECRLSGFNFNFENTTLLFNKFEQLLAKFDYQVYISICFNDKRNNFNKSGTQTLIKQPLFVELFITYLDEEDKSNFLSLNKVLHELNQENITSVEAEETEPMSVTKDELYLSCSRTLNDIESANSTDTDENLIDGMKDIYITQKIFDEIEMPHPFDKKPICEYYRTKGRCFKGSKCKDRHVTHSESSDDDDKKEFKWMQSISFMDKSFERHLRVGSIVGMRVTALYGFGVFYAFLTHGIVGFDNDATLSNLSDNEVEEEEINVNGLDFSSIHEMEESLGECMKYQYSSFNKTTEIIPNALVAVAVNDKIHRGSITSEISDNRYQVFLVDFGISVEANLEALFPLPKQYCSVYKQQCFMCKLHGVPIKNETDSKLFAEAFWQKVNKRILHAKVIDTFEDGMNFVELYDFINDNSNRSINSIIRSELNL